MSEEGRNDWIETVASVSVTTGEINENCNKCSIKAARNIATLLEEERKAVKLRLKTQQEEGTYNHV